ncbi:MAG: thiamine pyrophosphate-dependent enzyme [Vicinamibacterales bacterium]|jgi:pyruvate dehydrogenase E1 component alpha subunit|nr:pyruvate dehydrogenase (acetyl-transferring) E1 component subunit alpha [Acidobacteriota bacterium]MDP7294825.1 thiamine pyrophosphate-dependent enzyme [Vicinamibacterales bacterium]MDP7471519.1 thiamine pyrophosphate-dependent enzyme [Vicinamibacterales bacterium]MDP7671211.1 thiamine pyrophosphate-dependent enzyme [Vicinamibacterales bacterium]HJO38433.1 thiamine pyrophosphate-dependent enzyme [Vicinamibacterales bacterium]|tara:strand:+ start:2364 stop:3326 length:963 start_codon:yes stop_codon:yes gene_type:complete
MQAAAFEVTHHQFLDSSGRPVQPLPEFAHDGKTLRELYRAMVLTRTFDTKAIALQRSSRLGTYPSSLGQEAVSVGLAAAMAAEDVLLPAFREHGAQLWRGVTPTEMFLYWGGDERGSDFAVPREDLPNSVPIGSQAPQAVGNWRVPVVFVIANNQWAISVPRAAQTAAQTLAQKAIAAGIPGEQVDGNDVIAVRQIVGEALRVARTGGGPHVVEALTYRLSNHTTADSAKRYRDEAAVAEAWKHEPIARLRAYLTAQDVWSEDDERRLADECAAQIEQAAEAYLAMEPAPAETVFDYLYETLPAPLAWQRDQVVRGHHHG